MRRPPDRPPPTAPPPWMSLPAHARLDAATSVLPMLNAESRAVYWAMSPQRHRHLHAFYRNRAEIWRLEAQGDADDERRGTMTSRQSHDSSGASGVWNDACGCQDCPSAAPSPAAHSERGTTDHTTHGPTR
jgi:hypothetical protein